MYSKDCYKFLRISHSSLKQDDFEFIQFSVFVFPEKALTSYSIKVYIFTLSLTLSGSENLGELVATVMQRVGAVSDQEHPQLLVSSEIL